MYIYYIYSIYIYTIYIYTIYIYTIYIYTIYRRAIGLPPPSNCPASTKHCKFPHESVILEHVSNNFFSGFFFEILILPIGIIGPRGGIPSIQNYWFEVPHKTINYTHTPCHNVSGSFTPGNVRSHT